MYRKIQVNNEIFHFRMHHTESTDSSQSFCYFMFPLPEVELINMQLKSNAPEIKKPHDSREFVRNHWM